MTLKGFHIIFIVCSTLVVFFFSWWALQMYSESQQASYFLTFVVTAVSGLGLIFYGNQFLKKLKGIK